MRWQGRAGSQNVEDRRGSRMALPIGGGIGGIILLLLISALTGQNPADYINVGTSGTEVPGPATAEDDEQSQFTRVVLKSTEDVWGDVFSQAGHRYEPPVLVL